MNYKLSLLALLTVLVCAVLISGCTSSAPAGNDSSKTSMSVYPLNVTDDLDRMITLNAAPQRIVSLAPSNTEIIYGLGLGDRLVGVDIYSNYPAPAMSLPKMGGMINVSVQDVVAAKPDLVLVGQFTPNDTVANLTAAGLNVYSTHPDNVSDTLQAVEEIASICGVPDRGQQLADKMKLDVNEISQRTSQLDASRIPTVLMIITLGNESYVADRNGYMGDLITPGGGRNVATGPQMTPAEIVMANPDIVIVPLTDWTLATFDSLKYGREPWMQNLTAVKAGRVYPVGYDVVGRPGPRIGYAAALMARAIHPELFS
jgi:iron complex transport system substrate-binding protein